MGSKTSLISQNFSFFLSIIFLLSKLISTSCANIEIDVPNPNNLPPLTPNYPPTSHGYCPRDALKIGLCAKLLNNIDLLKVIGQQQHQVTPCCTLIQGLADIDAGACLCTAIKLSVLGDDIARIPISLGVLVGGCGGYVPQGFQCS
ncbi:unnamed protein product [Citrullus colocynthis]|uniref:Hydrophobic seed protein domain-containing protein n=1 Tax=Citrullus colocynthis TaxID=252529 RepID=A0ABP0XX24_9ROSI